MLLFARACQGSRPQERGSSLAARMRRVDVILTSVVLLPETTERLRRALKGYPSTLPIKQGYGLGPRPFYLGSSVIVSN